MISNTKIKRLIKMSIIRESNVVAIGILVTAAMIIVIVGVASMFSPGVIADNFRLFASMIVGVGAYMLFNVKKIASEIKNKHT